MPSTRSSRLTSKTFARSLRRLKMSACTTTKWSLRTRLTERGNSASVSFARDSSAHAGCVEPSGAVHDAFSAANA